MDIFVFVKILISFQNDSIFITCGGGNGQFNRPAFFDSLYKNYRRYRSLKVNIYRSGFKVYTHKSSV